MLVNSAPESQTDMCSKMRQETGMEVIEDRTNLKNGRPTRYIKGRFLGKGGFAKCYEVQDTETKEIFAAKIISKASISKPRTQAKLRSEISIHRSLDNEKVAHFHNYFEDTENVYMILELCPNQTLNDFVRKRPGKKLPESECKFFMHELAVALKYLHGRRVIHRDLKLGNLFLDAENRLKVGDFGLAAQLEHHGEKKRTICGTPNYIAPEILAGKNGHSYEVDVWSLGVILYTMLVGRPPFETADVKTTYRRIRYNQYSFPDTVCVSDSAKSLVTSILQTDPKARPSLDQILASPFFHASTGAHSMPVTICGYAASPRPVGASARSETPDGRVPDFARIDSPAPNFSHRSPSPRLQAPSVGPLANCKLGASRPPLSYRGNDENVVPSNGNDCFVGCADKGKGLTTYQGFLGQATAQSPVRTPSTTSVGGTQSYTPLPTNHLGMPRTNSVSRPLSSRELRESSPMFGGSYVPQKVVANSYGSARPASANSLRQPLSSRADLYSRSGGAIAATSATVENCSARLHGGNGAVESGTSAPSTRSNATQPVASRRPVQCATPPRVLQDRRCQPGSAQPAFTKEGSSSTPALALDGTPKTPGSLTTTAGRHQGSASYRKAPDSGIRGLLSCRSSQGIDAAEANLVACLGGAETSSSKSNPAVISPDALPELWVTKWVDYSSKYGVGYIMSDQSIGVYFNDSTKIILAPKGNCFDYITRRTQEKPEIRTTHTLEEYPDDLKKKVTLLRHFKNCMLSDAPERRDGASIGESSLPPPIQMNAQNALAAASEDFEPGQAPYVKKWTRNKHAIMFQLSNKIVQVVFFDKTEAVLSSKAHMVTYVDKRNHVCSYPLSDVMDVPSPELAKRLRYTKDILVNMLGARASDLGGA